jgi:hypothetical protein
LVETTENHLYSPYAIALALAGSAQLRAEALAGDGDAERTHRRTSIS